MTDKNYLWLILWIIIYSSACTGFYKNRKNCNSIRVVYNFPFINSSGILQNTNDSFDIYFIDEYTVYKFPYLHYKENEDSIIGKETLYEYFAFKNNSLKGYRINNASVNSQSVDSFLNERAFYNLDIYNSLYDSITEIKRSSTKNEAVRTFLYKEKYGPESPDSINFYFWTKRVNIRFSLSKRLDKETNLKVKRVRVIYNSQYYRGYDFKFPYRELYIDQKVIDSPACDDINKQILKIKSYSAE